MNYLDKFIHIFKPKKIDFYTDQIDILYYKNDKKISSVLSSLIKNKNIDFNFKFEIISERYLTKYLTPTDINFFVKELISNNEITDNKKNMYLSQLFELEHYHLHHLLKSEIFNSYEFQNTIEHFFSLSKDKRERYADFITDIIVNNKEHFKFGVDPSDQIKNSNTAPFVFVTYYLANKNYSQAVKILKNYRHFVEDPNINKFSDFRNTSHYLYQNELFLDIKLLREMNKQECLFLLADEQIEFGNRVGNIYGALCECYFKLKNSRTLSSEELNLYLITAESMILEYESKNKKINDKFYRFEDILSQLKISDNFNSHAINFINLVVDNKINIGKNIHEIFNNMITKNHLNMDFKNTLHFIKSFSHHGIGLLSIDEQYQLYINAYENSDFTNSKEKQKLEDTMVHIFKWDSQNFNEIRHYMDVKKESINKEYYKDVAPFTERINRNLFLHFKDDKINYTNDISLNFFFNSTIRDISYHYSTEEILDGILYIYSELNKIGFTNNEIHPYFIESLNQKRMDNKSTLINILNDPDLSLDKFRTFYADINLDIFKKYTSKKHSEVSFVEMIERHSTNENLKIKISQIEKEFITKEFNTISTNKHKLRL